MNESLNNNPSEPGYIRSIARDEGVHRAVAGVFVSVVIAAAKRALFPTA